MDVLRADRKPSERGHEDWFTGTVWLDEIATTEHPSYLRVHRVTFEPEARTAWHTHPMGQVLYVLSGIGFIQQEGKAAQRLYPGDTVYISPGDKHWHGATPNRVFVHIAVQEAADSGKNEATWFDHVSEAEYLSSDNLNERRK